MPKIFSKLIDIKGYHGQLYCLDSYTNRRQFLISKKQQRLDGWDIQWQMSYNETFPKEKHSSHSVHVENPLFAENSSVWVRQLKRWRTAQINKIWLVHCAFFTWYFLRSRIAYFFLLDDLKLIESMIFYR